MKVELKKYINKAGEKFMGKKLYVGNLPFSITEEKLKEEFSAAGNVTSVAIIQDKMSGRPRGFGFVEMATEEEAKQAIEKCNEKEIDGRKLTVNEAKERTQDRSGGGGRNNRFGQNSGGQRRNNW